MQLRAALETISDITGENIRVSRISHALTNRVYKIEGKEQAWALRINHENPEELGIQRQREQAVLDSIKQYSWAPVTDYIDSKLCLSQWFDGSQLILNTDQRTSNLANLIKQIHQIPTEKLKEQAPIYIDEQVKLLSEKVELSLTKNFSEILQQKTRLYSKPCELKLCHFDLHPNNVIESEVGLKILDWEYAALGDPVVEIACTIEGFKLDKEEANRFLNHFSLHLDDLELTICLVQALSLLWYMNRQSTVNFNIEQQAWVKRWQ